MNTTRQLLITTSLAAVAAASTIAPRDAHALQGGEDPSLLPVLIDKRFGADGRHQLGVAFSTAMATKFVEHTGFYLTYAYNFTDIFGLEIGGGYMFGSESSIMEQVRANFPMEQPPLSDLYQLQWIANVDAMIVPFYGKISFASEVNPGYDLFIVAGAGAAGLRKLECIEGGTAPGGGCPGPRLTTPTFVSSVGPAFNVGFGLRFYITKWIALRVELRDFFYLEADSNKGGLTFNLHFQGGVQFAFGR